MEKEIERFAKAAPLAPLLASGASGANFAHGHGNSSDPSALAFIQAAPGMYLIGDARRPVPLRVRRHAVAVRMLHDLACDAGVPYHYTAWCSSANALHKARRRGIESLAAESWMVAQVFEAYVVIKRDTIMFERDLFTPHLALAATESVINLALL